MEEQTAFEVFLTNKGTEFIRDGIFKKSEEIRVDYGRACMNSPLVNATFQLFQRGNMSFEECLMLAVVGLVKQNDILQRKVFDDELNKTVEFRPSFDLLKELGQS